MFGMNPSPIPSILCSPTFPPCWLSRYFLHTFGFISLSALATPIKVPPVPTPATKASTICSELGL